jgi:hypothetical protein
MIEIKFRAFHKGEMHPCYVGVDGLVRIEQHSEEWGHDVPLIIGSTPSYMGSIVKEVCPLVMQFTGLKDKNGKEIYEGDILGSPRGSRHIVSFDFKDAGYMAEMLPHREPCRITQSWIDDFQKIVIGNIYENPELLEANHDT